ASAACNAITPSANQTITFSAPAYQLVGGALTVSASASSGLTPVFTSATPSVCTVTSVGVVSLLADGLCTLHADQAGNAAFLAAPRVSRSFNVSQALRIDQGASVEVTMSKDGNPNPFALTLSTSNGASASLVWSIGNQPQNGTASVSAGGIVSYTRSVDFIANYTFLVQVRDSVESAAITFTVVITSANAAPEISGSPLLEIEVGSSYSFTPTASDADGDELTFSVANLPDW